MSVAYVCVYVSLYVIYGMSFMSCMSVPNLCKYVTTVRTACIKSMCVYVRVYVCEVYYARNKYYVRMCVCMCMYVCVYACVECMRVCVYVRKCILYVSMYVCDVCMFERM